jgi:hypothetical protein
MLRRYVAGSRFIVVNIYPKLFIMKRSIIMKKLFISPIAIALLLFSNLSFSESQTLNLGILTTFEAFTGGGGIANGTEASINGDIGTHIGIISGDYDSQYDQYNADDVTDQARKDLLRIYIHLNDLAVDYPGTHPPAFGGGETITPGVYYSGGAGSIGGALTLSGGKDDFFIIKFNGALTVGAAATVTLTGGIESSNVFWIADGAISVAANADVKGTLFSKTGAVGLGAGVVLEGRMLTMAGAITNGVGAVANPPVGKSSIKIFCEFNCIPAPEVDVLGVVSDYALFTSLGAVANTGITGIIGKIGSNGGAISGYKNGIHIGSEHAADAETAQAKIDLDNAYTKLMELPDTNTSHTPAFGTGETVNAGVYKIEGAGSLAGTITLDGGGDPDAIFVFKFAGAFNAGAQSKVILANGARRCNVFWLGGAGVATGAVNIGAASHVKGNFMSHGGASNSGAGVFLAGRQLSTGGAVNTNTGTIYTTPECVGPGSPPQVDHFKIEHDGSAINCQAERITISARTADHDVATDYTGTISLSTDTIPPSSSTNNVDWSGGKVDNLANNNGQFTYTFDNTEEGSVSLYLANSVAETIDINVEDPISGLSEKSGVADGTEDPPLEYKAAGFIFHDGTIERNDIVTQTAGIDANLVLEAVITNTATGACDAALIDDNDIMVGFECLNPSTCQRPLSLGSTASTTIIPIDASNTINYAPVTLDFGPDDDSTANVVMNYSDAGAIRLHAEHAFENGTIISGTSNSFVVKPHSYLISLSDGETGSDYEANSATDSTYKKAGKPFTVTVTARSFDESTTPNFGNESSPSVTVDLSHLLARPNNEDDGFTGVPGMLNGTWSNHINNSGRFSGDYSFNEVGIIDLTASINYLGTGIVTTTLSSIGRFTPASFSITAPVNGSWQNEQTSGNGGFTYIGQPFSYATVPAFTLNALSAAGDITVNYSDAWSKLTDLAIVFNEPTSDRVKLDSTAEAGAFMPLVYTKDSTSLDIPTGNGSFDFEFAAADSFVYTRDANSQVTPFAPTIDLVIVSITDSDSITTGVVDTTLTPVSPNATSTDMRFGRLGMSNEHGSELTALVMPMRVEIFNASGFFAVHSDDFATQIDFSNLILNDQLSTPTASTVTVVNSTASGGVFDVNFSSPGAGVDGDIDVTPLLGAAGANLEWLQYDWNTGTNTFDENPTAKATFGIYKGNSHQIFSKQAFQ